jgi:DNA processing protein
MTQENLFSNNVDNQINYYFWALSYFYKYLGYQGFKVVLNNYIPLRNFFNASSSEIEELFLKYYEFDPYLHSKILTDKVEHKLAFEYARKIINKANDFAAKNGYNETIYLKSENNIPKYIKQPSYGIDWLFEYSDVEKNIDYNKLVAVVGTRNPSKSGIDITKEVVKELVKNNFVIVSGLAYGIDTIAHETALDNNGLTIGIMGNGIQEIYPEKNKTLVKEILKSGGKIYTEHFPNTKGNRESFILRNRIIASISKNIVVTEAKEKSGTSYTVIFGGRTNINLIGIEFNYPNTINSVIKSFGGHLLSYLEIGNIVNFIKV